ncbi:hypothetical protein [Azonexus sp. IMCC34839]|uniref:hypothetical protein n=1 Tax=Azonexus sp. IMCC34839 TaxID=3133695 RepID=UPI003999CED0
MQLNLPPTLSTDELAALAKVQPQSIRAAICRTGHWMGIRPVKLKNRRLLWDSSAVAAALGGTAK